MRGGVTGAWLALLCVVVLLTAAASHAHPGLHEQEATVDAAIASDPENAEHHATRGRILAEKGDWDGAIASFERALVLGSDRDDIAVAQGAVYLQAGWPRTAKARFSAVVGRAPGRADAHLGRGRAWLALEHPELAAADFERAFDLSERPKPTQIVEWQRALSAADQPEAALRALDRGTERIGPVPGVVNAAVDLCVELGRPEDALERLDLLLQQSPSHPVWLARRGELLELAGRDAEARDAYRRALSQIEARSRKRDSKRLAELATQLRTQLDAASDTSDPVGE